MILKHRHTFKLLKNIITNNNLLRKDKRLPLPQKQLLYSV